MDFIIFGLYYFWIVSPSKNKTLHSISLEYLNEIICILYPFTINNNISNNNNDYYNERLSNIFRQFLFNENNLNVFYNVLIKNSILAHC